MALLHSTQCIVAVSLCVCFDDIKQGSLFDISSLKKQLRICRPSKMGFFYLLFENLERASVSKMVMWVSCKGRWTHTHISSYTHTKQTWLSVTKGNDMYKLYSTYTVCFVLSWSVGQHLTWKPGWHLNHLFDFLTNMNRGWSNEQLAISNQ